MCVSYEEYRAAEAFVGMQHYVTIDTIGPLPKVNSTGLTSFKGPSIIVSIPYPVVDIDYTDSICVLFHEWGHFLDTLISFDDAEDEEELIKKSTDYYFKKIKSLPEKGRVRVEYEKLAWSLGLKGCTIKSKTYKGLQNFLNEKFLPDMHTNILARFEELKVLHLKVYQ